MPPLRALQQNFGNRYSESPRASLAYVDGALVVDTREDIGVFVTPHVEQKGATEKLTASLDAPSVTNEEYVAAKAAAAERTVAVIAASKAVAEHAFDLLSRAPGGARRC